MTEMIEKKIRLQYKTVYGTERAFPMCPLSKFIASMIERKTFNNEHIQKFVDAGYEVEVERVRTVEVTEQVT